VLTVDLKRLSLRPGQKVLDIGCGRGRHVCGLARVPGLEVVGSDIKYSELVETRKSLTYEYEFHTYKARSCHLVVSDIGFLPFENGSLDVVICCEILEHLVDLSMALKELARVLKPGGQLAVSVPRYYPERVCWSLSRSYSATSDGHVRIFRQSELKREIEGYGFQNWAFHFAHSLHTPYWWLKCIAGLDSNSQRLVHIYHRFLVWDIMKKPRFTRLLESLLNPILGKSVVMYFTRVAHVCT